SVAEEEWKVRMLEVAFAPSQHGSVEGDDESGVARLLGTLHQACRQFVILTPVELKPAWGFVHGLRDFFYGAGRHSAENEWDAERCGSSADGDLGFGMNDALH